MSQIPDAALRKILQEIETKAIESQWELEQVKAAIATKQRDARFLELTQRELNELPASARTYRGIGKMFVRDSADEVKQGLTGQREQMRKEADRLEKRQTYLSTTLENSQAHIRQMLSHEQH